jgi:hypothetical protein
MPRRPRSHPFPLSPGPTPPVVAPHVLRVVPCLPSGSSSTIEPINSFSCTDLDRPSTHTQAMCNDREIIATLKAMQAFVPDSPRTSFVAPFSPDLEVEQGGHSCRPSYGINQPQLYPYTLSDDDLWAEQMVANILAVSRLVATNSLAMSNLIQGPLSYRERLTVILFRSLILPSSL